MWPTLRPQTVASASERHPSRDEGSKMTTDMVSDPLGPQNGAETVNCAQPNCGHTAHDHRVDRAITPVQCVPAVGPGPQTRVCGCPGWSEGEK